MVVWSAQTHAEPVEVSTELVTVPAGTRHTASPVTQMPMQAEVGAAQSSSKHALSMMKTPPKMASHTCYGHSNFSTFISYNLHHVIMRYLT